MFREHPVVHLERAMARAEIAFEVFFAFVVMQHLFRGEAAKEFFDVVIGALAGEKLACGDVKETHATGRFSEVYGLSLIHI